MNQLFAFGVFALAFIVGCQDPVMSDRLDHVQNVVVFPDHEEIDAFLKEHLPNTHSASVNLYNRWGGTVYEEIRNDHQWIGWSEQISKLAPDVFVYRVVIDLQNGQKVDLQGSTTVVR